jgi:protein-L-isoaspartate(D-aspartate) O-methyltransferase
MGKLSVKSEPQTNDFAARREEMVQTQIYNRGVRDELVLQAMRKVPRHAFLPVDKADQAYSDWPVPIAEGQTISQPYIVAYMVEALNLKGGEKVLEIGAGSGYAAAVLAEIASEVYTIERIGQLAQHAASSLIDAGYDNVHVMHDDGTRGWDEEAPFDAILVSAGGPKIPDFLKKQLRIGGRIVIPIGTEKNAQELVRVTRLDDERFEREDLADVRFVPLIGEQGWQEPEPRPEIGRPRVILTRPKISETLPELIAKHGEAFDDPHTANLDALIERIGEKRVVLIGEATHGTSEFYRMRARITQRLIEEKGFNIVAVETDWPDAARIDHYVRHRDALPSEWEAFSRFPTWMWRNEEVREFMDWLHNYNAEKPYKDRTGFYGLDLYSLYNSSRAIIKYLDDVDPDLAAVARDRYGCLSPWEPDPAAYGHAALTGAYHSCEKQVTKMLVELHTQRQKLSENNGHRLFDAQQNAQLVVNAENYYRTMYYGSRASWNLRDQHMYQTLQRLLQFHDGQSKAVVWAHNSHIGDASATEMSARGETNLGEHCKKGYGDQSYRIGFGTDHGTVAAASTWDGPMEIKQIQPSHKQSYERLFHLTDIPGMILPMRAGHEFDLVNELSKPRLERAIGVIYRPETELASHYFEAELPLQFNEYIWIDQTSAVTPLPAGQIKGVPETYPFGL